jgi:hypothetical protein
MVVLIPPTDVPASLVTRVVESHDAVYALHKIAYYQGPASRGGDLKAAVEGQQLGWERNVTSVFSLEEGFQRRYH